MFEITTAVESLWLQDRDNWEPYEHLPKGIPQVTTMWKARTMHRKGTLQAWFGNEPKNIHTDIGLPPSMYLKIMQDDFNKYDQYRKKKPSEGTKLLTLEDYIISYRNGFWLDTNWVFPRRLVKFTSNELAVLFKLTFA